MLFNAFKNEPFPSDPSKLVLHKEYAMLDTQEGGKPLHKSYLAASLELIKMMLSQGIVVSEYDARKLEKNIPNLPPRPSRG